MNVATIPVAAGSKGQETKHEKFLRLAEARVTRTLDDIRLINQLSARTYEYKPAEVEIIVKTLADSVHDVAKTFAVPFASKVGKGGKAETGSIFEEPKVQEIQQTSVIKTTVARALDLLKQGEVEAAQALLVDLL